MSGPAPLKVPECARINLAFGPEFVPIGSHAPPFQAHAARRWSEAGAGDDGAHPPSERLVGKAGCTPRAAVGIIMPLGPFVHRPARRLRRRLHIVGSDRDCGDGSYPRSRCRHPRRACRSPLKMGYRRSWRKHKGSRLGRTPDSRPDSDWPIHLSPSRRSTPRRQGCISGRRRYMVHSS